MEVAVCSWLPNGHLIGLANERLKAEAKKM
jgi:hypothetical protein